MAAVTANHLKYLLATKVIDFENDTFRIALMATGFSFNRDTHEIWADVSASEHANGSGYTTGGVTLSGVTVTEDDENDRTKISWNDVYWIANGADLGPSPGAIIRDSTAPGDPIVVYIDFGGEQVLADGGKGNITNIQFWID